ncbi:MAG: single-stranded-DNA-specific exonuclease RecJ [Deltaproteobacteria bacterium]|nr:single-stranded-DNA-specific exonuclease RecJ [Deltaproteobacteria bacterium]
MTLFPKQFRQRTQDRQVFEASLKFGFSPLQARIIAGRASGQDGCADLESLLFPALKNLHHPELLKDCLRGAELIVEAIRSGKKIGVLTDYDVDGICSHVVVYKALRQFGVPGDRLISLIGHRMHDGYGISAKLVDKILALPEKPDLVVTADCGSSDEKQIRRLREAGIDVIVTDHHAIPEAGIPQSAMATINPLRNDCHYPDKFISGCMVSWLLLCMVRNRLAECGFIAPDSEKLSGLLDFVGLSTVADAVTFVSPTNRAVVNSGLRIINQMRLPAWLVLGVALGKSEKFPFTAEDLAFQVAPRINARSRMADPYAALNFFLAESREEAERQLQKLERNNEERKLTERDMVKKARKKAEIQIKQHKKSLVVSGGDFHAGVQGIVAARLVDSYGRPAVVLSPFGEGEILSGSARTIPGVHLFQVLRKMHEQNPELFLSFGGHKGAAGLKIKKEKLELFRASFEDIVCEELYNQDMKPVVLTDGYIEADRLNFGTLAELQKLEPFGRDFDEPAFEGIFNVTQSRMVGAEEPVHLSLKLRNQGREFQAIWFNAVHAPGDKPSITGGNTIRCAFKLKLNNFRGQKNIQLLIEYAEPHDIAGLSF